MANPISRTLAHWRIEPGIDIFDILTEAEPGTLHCHATYNFGCVLEGEARLDIGEQSFDQPTGSVVLLNAFGAHASTWLAQENRYFVVYVGESAWSQLLQRVGAPAGTRFAEPIVHDKILFHALKGIWAELQSRPETVSLDDIAGLLDMVIRRGKTETDTGQIDMLPETQAILQGLAPQHARPEGSMRVEDVATALGMTRFQFSRLCQANHGMQPRRLKLQLMVARAQIEISKGVSLTEAALLAGFSDQSHMTREFRKTIGMTPREYQAVLPQN